MTVRVRVLIGVCDRDGLHAAGEVVELPEVRAAQWIEAGIAEQVPMTRAPEATARAGPAERATLPSARKRGE